MIPHVRRFGARAALVLLLPLAMLSAPEAIDAQTSGVSAGVEGVFQSFSFSEAESTGLSSVQLLTLPFSGRVGLGSSARVEIHGAWARGTLTRSDDSTAEIAGPTDTEVRLVGELANGQVTALAFALLPTGTSTFEEGELELAGIVGADLLPFRISNWGAGGGFGAAVTLTRSIGDWGVGLTGGYTAAREYEPLSDDPVQYRPGNRIRVRAGFDRTFNQNQKGSFRVSWQRFGDDALDGQNVFRSGDRLEAMGSWAFPAGARASAIVYAGYQHRSEGTALADLTPRASQGLALVGGGLRTPFLGGVLAPSADLRLVRRDDGTDQGVLFGGGATLELPAGSWTLLPSARFRAGNVTVRDDMESGFTGFELGFGVRFGG